MHLDSALRSDGRQGFKSALRELSVLPKEEASTLLEGLAVEPNGTFRSRAIDGMLTISPERAGALALRFLNDPEWFVRIDAINTLRKLRSRVAAPLIAHLLATDPDETVRSWAAFSLGELGDAAQLPALAAAIEQDTGTDHEGRPIRETAINSVNSIRSRLAVQDKTATL